MANLSVKEKIVDPYIVAIDSTLLKAKGCMYGTNHVLVKEQYLVQVWILMQDGDLITHTRGWIFGYKLH